MAQDRRIIKTKAAIREAFFSILKDNKSSRVTITEIASRANIDRKTFYLHYDSPEAIMDEFYKNLINDFLLILEKNDFFDRSFDVLSFFQSLNALDRLQEDRKVFIIRPELPEIKRFETDPDTLEAYYQHGLQIAKSCWKELQAYLLH